MKPDDQSRNQRPGVATELWWLALDSFAAERPDWRDFLSPEELARAGRFAFPELQQRFGAARAGLRTVLSSYCGVHPRELDLQQTEAGKPFLEGDFQLEFNLSHSAGFALIAVNRSERVDSSVGVDLEQFRSKIDWLGIASQVFHPLEQACVEVFGLQGFFGIWTRKEAWLKAQGSGWSEQAKSISVIDRDWTPEQEGRLRLLVGGREWWVSSISLPTNQPAEWSAALCQSERELPISWRGEEDLRRLLAAWI